ncbi:MAG: Guanylate kinase [Alphaproteobacteria bacterium]|nr:Guanylate kinase [Alphaproteobacteria bacterium]
MPVKRLSEFHVGNFDDTNLPHIGGLQRRGLMLALSSPSGAGKTTMTRMLLEMDPDVRLSVSCTTRAMRPGEVEGVHYYFTSVERFEELLAKGEFLEHTRIHGNYYGTPKTPVSEAMDSGRDILFDIDTPGVEQLGAFSKSDLVSVFILPPSADEMEVRLRKRGTDSEEVITRRLHDALEQTSHYRKYDYVIINRNLEDSMLKLRTILGAERMKLHRLEGLDDFVTNLREDIQELYVQE